MKAIFQTPTPQLETSLDFYRSLGFTAIENRQYHFFTDGKAIIEVNPDRYARAGVKLYGRWREKLPALKALTAVVEKDQSLVLSDGSGSWIYLIEEESFPLAELPAADASLLGNNMGLTLEVVDMAGAVKIWETLGLSISMGSAEQGWVALSHESGFGLSLMKPFACPHLFFNPSLSFFNGDKNRRVIEDIRAAGIPITEEITHFNKDGLVDNIIVRDPGGLGFFVFSD